MAETLDCRLFEPTVSDAHAGKHGADYCPCGTCTVPSLLRCRHAHNSTCTCAFNRFTACSAANLALVALTRSQLATLACVEAALQRAASLGPGHPPSVLRGAVVRLLQVGGGLAFMENLMAWCERSTDAFDFGLCLPCRVAPTACALCRTHWWAQMARCLWC